jgi:DHA1 family bicyclomycin/chloramphenicol resistance-like MFS transporter
MLSLTLVMHAFLVPNMNSLAMVPMGEVAGTASAVIGTISSALGALLGWVIDRAYDGSVLPMTLGFLISGLVAAAITAWAGATITEPASVEPIPVYPVE